MKILHGTWIPTTTEDFVQTGAFYLWIETDAKRRRRAKKAYHPYHLFAQDLAAVLMNELGFKPSLSGKLVDDIAPQHMLLPTAQEQP
ncbi:MAG: hypothetical protein ACFB4J_15125, partial [Elainellaceae cyanobacterium]